VLDLNTGVDLDEVVAAHLVDQELGRTGIPIVHALRELDRVVQDRLADLLGKMECRRDLDDLLVPALH
jgi:hypothetical protein